MTASASNPIASRQRWMSGLARAGAAEMTASLADVGTLPTHSVLRGPEIGLVMLRGREGGAGGRFNLGEMTVTRCTVRLAGGQIGHATIAGRDLARAELAAQIDAALQDAAMHDELQRAVIQPLAEAQDRARRAQARQAAATQVQFFTMATMRS